MKKLTKTLLLLTVAALTSCSANSSLIKTGEKTALFTDTDGLQYNIFNSTVLDHSCRVTIPASCSVYAVGQRTYTQLLNSNVVSSEMFATILSENTGELDIRSTSYWIDNPHWHYQLSVCNTYHSAYGPGGSGATCSSTFLEYMTATLVEPQSTVVPIPVAVWLFASGLIGLVLVARRK